VSVKVSTTKNEISAEGANNIRVQTVKNEISVMQAEDKRIEVKPAINKIIVSSNASTVLTDSQIINGSTDGDATYVYGVLYDPTYTPMAIFDALVSVEEDVGVERWGDTSGNNRDFAQPDTSAQPTKTADSISFDGINDGLIMDNALLQAGINIYMVRKAPIAENASLSFRDGAQNFSLVAFDGSPDTELHRDFGTPTFRLNGSSWSPADRDAVHAGLNTGERELLTILDADTSNWATLHLADYPNIFAELAEYYDIVFTDGSEDATAISQIESNLARKNNLEIASSLPDTGSLLTEINYADNQGFTNSGKLLSYDEDGRLTQIVHTFSYRDEDWEITTEYGYTESNVTSKTVTTIKT